MTTFVIKDSVISIKLSHYFDKSSRNDSTISPAVITSFFMFQMGSPTFGYRLNTTRDVLYNDAWLDIYSTG